LGAYSPKKVVIFSHNEIKLREIATLFNDESLVHPVIGDMHNEYGYYIAHKQLMKKHYCYPIFFKLHQEGK
jgi:FlaA1/EpsC-like NDP-sugar epimerase